MQIIIDIFFGYSLRCFSGGHFLGVIFASIFVFHFVPHLFGVIFKLNHHRRIHKTDYHGIGLNIDRV